MTLAVAATVVGVHLAVVAPAISPVTPPLALTAYSTTNLTGATATTPPVPASATDRRRRQDGRGHG